MNEKEKDDDPVVPRKKEKMEINYNVKKGWAPTQPSNLTVSCRPRVDLPPRSSLANRRSIPSMREKKKTSPEVMGKFFQSCKFIPISFENMYNIFCCLVNFIHIILILESQICI